ncbi:MAG: NAD-binding protein [Fimbriimonadia bacterium]|jgi:trk system potassium uptake protein TrkA
MYVVLVGGGAIGAQVARRLRNEGHEFLMIEKSKSRAQYLQELFGADAVLHGDGCEVRVMAEAGIGRADVVAAITGDDEDNLVVCQMAKRRFNVKRTIARVIDPRHEELFRRLGVDVVISSTTIIYNLIEQEIETGEVLPIGALQGGGLEVAEAEITNRSPACGKAVGSLYFADGTAIVAVVREGRHMVATPDLVLRPGDVVVAIGPSTTSGHLHAQVAAPVGTAEVG